MSRTALVTGATGFLGSHLCRRLTDDGFDVTVLCRSAAKTEILSDLPLKKIVGDVTDERAVGAAVEKNEFVFHAAAHLAYWGVQREAQRRVNVEGTKNVVRACLRSKVEKLIHVSSVAAVGIPEDAARPANEDFRFNLENSRLDYHLSKKRAEEFVLEAAANGLNAVVVNPGSIWGEFGKGFRGAEAVQKVRSSKIVPYFTGGICVVHVADVVEGIMAASQSGESGERYILGGENVTLEAIARSAARKMNLERKFVAVPNAATALAALLLESWGRFSRRRPRITFAAHYCASRFHFYDSAKAKAELGFAPRSFSDILDECVAFVESKDEARQLNRIAAKPLKTSQGD